MKALMLEAPHLLTVAEREVPVPGSGEVLVRMLGVGICGSDLSVFYGHREVPYYPWQMGHEGVGEIVALGSDVVGRSVGERVVIEPNYCCFSCSECRKGNTSGCLNRVIVGMKVPGVMAEFAVVPAAFAWRAPAGLTLAELICLEPLTVGVAAMRRSQIQKGERCLVVGAGSTGLLLLGLLVARGFDAHFVEVNPQRSQLATELGALPHQERNSGYYDKVFETSGSEGGFETALASAAPGATVVLIGLASHAVHVIPADIVRRRLTLVGSMIYDHPIDFATTVGEAPNFLHKVVQARFGLEDAQRAFEQAHEVPGKSWISIVDEGDLP